jgi:hypothetical protein
VPLGGFGMVGYDHPQETLHTFLRALEFFPRGGLFAFVAFVIGLGISGLLEGLSEAFDPRLQYERRHDKLMKLS